MPLTRVAKIGIGWSICVGLSIYGFYLSKESIIKKRYEHMKIRERMRLASETTD